MIVKAKRGRGRSWQVVAPAAPTQAGPAWRLVPLGPDVGSFGGVKPISRAESELLEAWERA
jgi:hypothetical protein